MNLSDLIPIATAKDRKRLLKLMYNTDHTRAIKENNTFNNLKNKNKMATTTTTTTTLTSRDWKKASVKDKKKALKSFSSKYVDYEWEILPHNVKEMVSTGKINDYYGTGYGA